MALEDDITLERIEIIFDILTKYPKIEDEPVILEKLFVLSKRLLVRADRLIACLKLLQFSGIDQVSVFKYAYGLGVESSDATLKNELWQIGIQLQHYLNVQMIGYP